jgi:hypothetical protein
VALADASAATGEGALVSLTQTDSNGRYRLEGIPPGRYHIQAGLVDAPTYFPGVPGRAAAQSVQVAAGAIVEGLDFPLVVSAGVRVSGRIPLSAVRPAQLRLAGGARGFQGNVAQVRPDGTFEFLRVPPGNYNLTALPGNTVLPALPIVVAEKDIEVGLPSGTGVKVSGVVGLGPRSLRPADQRVVFTGSSAWAQVDAAVARDGKFEVSVPAGTYSIRTLPGDLMPHATVIVAGREISGLIVPGFLELTGNVLLQDGQRLPHLSPALMIQATPVKGATRATAVRPDGEFRFPLIEGEYRMSLGKLPAGFVLKSMVYGTADLLNAPLNLDGSAGPGQIRVTIERTP